MNRIDAIPAEENDAVEKVLGLEHRDWMAQMQPILDERRAQTEKLRIETLNCGSPKLALALKNRPIMIEALRKIVTLRLDLRKEYSLKTPALLSESCLSKLRSDLEDLIEHRIKDDPESRPAAGDIVAFVRVNIEKLMLNNPTPKPSKQPEKTTAEPRVFISYSWDNEEHKTWVLDLSARLRKDGIDAFIDQTHLTLGARSPQFMESSVRESNRVLIICTPPYKVKFDNRSGGVGYEGHIITAEIVNEVGKNKFIPVLRKGNWETTPPTALSGAFGVDLSNDSALEYKKLVENLHGINPVTPVGPRPSWLGSSVPNVQSGMATLPSNQDAAEYQKQRNKLPETPIWQKISAVPRLSISICPSEFKRARFQSVHDCEQFMQTSYLNVQRGTVGPTSFSSFVDGDEWTASEFDNDSGIQRCALFCSGQFVHNLGLTTKWESKDQVRVHYILDIVTRTFDFAAKMTAKGVLKPLASISFDFFKMARINLGLGEDKGNPNLIKDCWCQDEQISIHRVLNSVELQGNRREAFAVAQEIYSKFQWNDPPIDKLRQDQAERSGPASP